MEAPSVTWQFALPPVPRGDVILHAAFPHPPLKRLVRFKCGPDSVMRADDLADALSRYFEPRGYQRDRGHLCLAGPLSVAARELNGPDGIMSPVLGGAVSCCRLLRFRQRRTACPYCSKGSNGGW
jgi:hypothetical protein